MYIDTSIPVAALVNVLFEFMAEPIDAAGRAEKCRAASLASGSFTFQRGKCVLKPEGNTSPEAERSLNGFG